MLCTCTTSVTLNLPNPRRHRGRLSKISPGWPLSAAAPACVTELTVGLEAEGQKPLMRETVEGQEQRVDHMKEVIKQLKGGEEKEVQQAKVRRQARQVCVGT